jgi:hypothetical protein
MDQFPAPMRVARCWVSDHVDYIRFRKGESLAIGHRNQQYPEFVWGATEDGHAGWVPEEYIEMVGPSDAVALRDYHATQLTVVEGESVEALERMGDWILCRNAAGGEGWVHHHCLEPVPEADEPTAGG